jgi:predicted amidohydrolase YtcJ
MKLKGPGTRVIDLAGRAMLPGFVDARGHVMMGGIQALSANLLAPPDGTVTDLASMQKVLREWMAANAAAVQKTGLVLGFGYGNAMLAEHRHPTRDDLDAVSREIPILIVHQSGHILAVNSKAIEVVGTTAETPDPSGGVIRRRAGSREPVVGAIDWTVASDIQALMHAHGEAASGLPIAAAQAATTKHGAGKDRRPVLIHGRFLRLDQVDAYNRLGVLPSLFPMHTFHRGDWHRDHTVGPMLADNISPTGSCVARGMRFTSHHDAPVAFPDSLRVLDATVTRRSRSGDIIGPAQRVGVIKALKAMTIWPAWQHFEEGTKSSIGTVKLDDFEILSKDPTAVNPETLGQLDVGETIKEGTTVFALTAAEQKKADLMLKPGRDGGYVFPRALAAADPHGHGGGCMSPVLLDLASAMVGAAE